MQALRGLSGLSGLGGGEGAGAPEPPGSLVSSPEPPDDATPTLVWDSVAGATSYELERMFDWPASSWDVVSGSPFAAPTTSFTEPVQIAGGVYKWRVRAVNGVGESEWAYTPDPGYLIPA